MKGFTKTYQAYPLAKHKTYWPKCLALFICFLNAQTLCAQLNFANAYQAPLLLNPSLTGSKNKTRISTIFNHINHTNSKYTNTYLSLDLAPASKRIWIGTYYATRFQSKDTIPSNIERNFPNLISQNYLSCGSSQTVGLSASIKYNIRSKSNLNNIAMTTSPSVYIEYTQNTETQYSQIPTREYQYKTETPQIPEIILYPDSTSKQIIKQRLHNPIIKIGSGISLTSTNLILLCKLSYTIDAGKDEYTQHLPTYRYDSKTFSETLFGMESGFHTAYSLNISKNSSLIPMGGIGHSFLFNLKTPNSIYSSYSYELHLKEKKKSQITSIHLSCMAKVHFALLGISYTKTPFKDYKGITLGIQSKKIKLLYCFRFQKERFNEVTFSYTPK